MRINGETIPLEALRAAFCLVDVNPLEVYKKADLTPAWQQAFREGRTQDPGYSKICSLIAWFTGKDAPSGAYELLCVETQKARN